MRGGIENSRVLTQLHLCFSGLPFCPEHPPLQPQGLSTGPRTCLGQSHHLMSGHLTFSFFSSLCWSDPYLVRVQLPYGDVYFCLERQDLIPLIWQCALASWPVMKIINSTYAKVDNGWDNTGKGLACRVWSTNVNHSELSLKGAGPGYSPPALWSRGICGLHSCLVLSVT